MLTRIGTLILICMVLPLTIVAQVKFYLQAKNSVATGEQYKVSYVLENANGSNFKPPKNFEGFNLLSGPNQSSSFQWINGKVSQSLSYSYYLQPHTVGTFTVPAASILADGQEMTTESITVTVTKGSDVSKQNNNASASNSDWKEQAKEGIFVRLYADKTTPYVGEQVTIYAKLYQSVASYNTQIVELPKFNGVWKQEFDLSNNQDWQDEQVNGKNYKTLLIGKYAVFPQKDGDITIDPFKLTTVLRIKDQTEYNPFDWTSFFSRNTYREVPYDFQSSSVMLKVKPLPTNNQPLNFSGAVGSFDYTVTLDNPNAETGEAITLNTKMFGTGNIMMAELPSVTFPESMEQFDPELNEVISENSTYVNGRKEATYLLIPQEPGDYEIPSIAFSYFDVNAEDYQTIYSDPINITVTGENLNASASVSNENVSVIENDIRYINNSYDLVTSSNGKWLGEWQFAGAIASAPLLLLFLFFARKTKLLEPNNQQAKQKRAAKLAKKRLSTAALYLKEENKTAYYQEINQALQNYLSDKLQLNRSDLNQAAINTALQNSGASKSSTDTLQLMFEKCNMALYSPLTVDEMEHDYDKAANLIIAIENEIS